MGILRHVKIDIKNDATGYGSGLCVGGKTTNSAPNNFWESEVRCRGASHSSSPNLCLLAALGSLLSMVWVLLEDPSGGPRGVVPRCLDP